MENNIRLIDVIPQSSMWYHQSLDFFKEWLIEIKKRMNTKRKYKRSAYRKVLVAWAKMWDDESLADIAIRARKIM